MSSQASDTTGFKKIPGTVWAVGISTFLINISTALVFTLSICFMGSVLEISKDRIAFFQALVDAISHFVKLLSGIISDFIHRRKIIVLIGFIAVFLAKPILGLATSLTLVLVARFLDRVGNGIQSTPRDALIGDVAPKDARGRCFGIRQALAVLGSSLGGIAMMLLMFITNDNYRIVFFLATIPCFLAIVVFARFVKDPLSMQEKPKKYNFPITFSELNKLGGCFWQLMIIVVVFMLSRCGGEAPLILRAQELGIAAKLSSVSLIIYNATNALISYPLGLLSDLIGRQYVLLLGFLCMMIAHIILSTTTSFLLFFIGVAFWGMQLGITQSMFMALIADFVPIDHKGTAIGIFHFTYAITIGLSGFMFKQFAVMGSMSYGFMAAAVMSVLSFILCLFFFPKKCPISKS